MDHTMKRSLLVGFFVALLAVFVFVLLLSRLALQPSQGTSDAVHQSGGAQNGQDASGNGKEQPGSSTTNDRTLHIMPGLFGDPVSDMRTYSIPLVYSYRGHVPPRTTLVLQGFVVGSFGTQGFLVADASGQREVLCEMSSDELEDAAYYYKRGDVVQIMGKYFDRSLLPVMRGCTMSSKSDNVVELPDERLHRRVADDPSKPHLGPTNNSNTDGGLEHVGGTDSAPKLIYQVNPQFSEEARKAKFSGNVQVYLVVDVNGNPTHVHVVRPIGMGLDEKAIEAVSQYKFKPAMKNGKPVAVDIYIDVNFQTF
jgi:TonB family protein